MVVSSEAGHGGVIWRFNNGDGADCGKPRQLEVRFTCEPTRSAFGTMQVEETEPCAYRFTLQGGSLFMPTAELLFAVVLPAGWGCSNNNTCAYTDAHTGAFFDMTVLRRDEDNR